MSNITASMVKELREKTSAGMLDCKKALTENNGDMEAAVDWLRKKGLASAAKKAGRVAAEGLVSVAVNENGTSAAVVEVNSETDFVSKNEIFQDFCRTVAGLALETSGDVEEIKAVAYPSSDKNTGDYLTEELIAKIGENMNLRRSVKLSVENGVVCSYIHNAAGTNIGKIAVMVALESDGDKDVLNAKAKQIAMHIAASNPLFLTVADVDADALSRERKIFEDQAKASGKPENIIEKMVEGRVRKYYDEVVLEEQAFIMDTDKKVKAVVADLAKELGTDVKLSGYVRFGLGEGIEKKEEDFAAEVAAQLGK
jgi:elongation factor Ts